MHYTLPLLFAAAHAHLNAPLVPREERYLEREAAPLPTLFARGTFSEPCEEVSASWSAQSAQETGVVYVGAKVAYDCLQSVPVDTDGDVLEIEELKLLVNYQSNIAYLKQGTVEDGPEGATHNDPVDVLGELDNIATGVKNGSYASEWEVQTALSQLFLQAHDNHFGWRSDIQDVLPFTHPGIFLMSLSKNGTDLPKVYSLGDLVTAYNKSATQPANFTPSALKSINGKAIVDYMINDHVATSNNFHDLDAQWNGIFPNQAANSMSGGSSVGSWNNPALYFGPSTTYVFENGTTRIIDNKAAIRPAYNFTGVTDGKSFFATFCSGPQETATTTSSSKRAVSSSAGTSLPTPKGGYPYTPWVQSSLAFQGYYLNGSAYDKTAVLAIPSFEPSKGPGTDETSPAIETQKLLRAFFADAVKQGKEKLIIDLRSNGGGQIDLGFELFKQLFPSMDPYGGTRYRAHEAFKLFSATVTSLLNNQTYEAEMNATIRRQTEVGAGVFDYRNVRDENGTAFTSFWDYYGPYDNNNDTYTSVRRYNYSMVPGGYTSSGEFNLTGYLNNYPPPAQPFKAENIVLIQDGACSSTCTIFTELMREQGGVQQIAVGGRPQYGAMQGVGGTKGANIIHMDSLAGFATQAIENTATYISTAMAKQLSQGVLGKWSNISQTYIRTSHTDTKNPISGSVNFLDNMRQDDTTGRPLEFYWEAADCRLFNTIATWQDVTELWRNAYDAKWGNGTCVDGSVGDKTAISMVDKQPFNAAVNDTRDGTSNNNGPDQFKGAASGLQSAGFSVLVAATLAVAVALL